MTNCDSCSPRDSRFAGSFMRDCGIQICSFFSSNDDDNTCVRIRIFVECFLRFFGGLRTRRDFGTQATCQLYIYEFTILSY